MKIPEKQKKTIEAFRTDTRTIFGGDLVSVMLYGSIVSGGFDPKRSDINSLILVKKYDLNALAAVAKRLRFWRRKRIATPLLMTEKELKTSLDVFPMEYLDISGGYTVLEGDDPWRDIDIPRVYLRLQCEHEARSKLVKLKEFFFETGAKRRGLLTLLSASYTSLVVIFKNVLRLEKRELPGNRRDIVATVSGLIGFDPAPVHSVGEIRSARKRPAKKQLLPLYFRYLECAARVVDYIDQWKTHD